MISICPYWRIIRCSLISCDEVITICSNIASVICQKDPGRSFWPPDSTWSFRKEAGKILGSQRKTPEITEIGSSIPVEKRWDFFRQIPINFLWFPTRIGQNLSEKFRKYPIGILLPKKTVELHGNGCFQAGLFHMGKSLNNSQTLWFLSTVYLTWKFFDIWRIFLRIWKKSVFLTRNCCKFGSVATTICESSCVGWHLIQIIDISWWKRMIFISIFLLFCFNPHQYTLDRNNLQQAPTEEQLNIVWKRFRFLIDSFRFFD